MILVRALVLLGLVICGAQAQVLTDDVDPDLELQLKRSGPRLLPAGHDEQPSRSPPQALLLPFRNGPTPAIISE